jgi:hypothetical protein
MNHEFWYLSRAAGFTAYGLLFVSVALGIMIGTRLTGRFSRGDVFDIHRFTSVLALVFTLFHVYILLGDGYFNFNIWQLSLPFASPYLPWQTAAGVAGLYVLAVVVASSYLRRFIGYRAWRAIHFATFALFGVATLHGVTAGTDASAAWARLIYFSASLTTLALIVYRVQYHLPAEAHARRMRFGAATAALLVAGILMLSTGVILPSGRNDEGGVAAALAASAEQRAVIASMQEARATLAYDDEQEEREHERREHDDDDREEYEDD